MNYKEFYKAMQDGKLVSDNWRNVLALVESNYKVTDIDDYLKILVLYFSLIDDGSVYMLLDSKVLVDKFTAKIEGLKIEKVEDGEDRNQFYTDLLTEVVSVANIVDKIKNFTEVLDNDGKSNLFVIKDNKLFTRKHFNAVVSIKNSINRIFVNNSPITSGFSYTSCVDTTSFRLSSGQEEIIAKGLYNNLLVTGGPGTGKTTSIFFLLLTLLLEDPNYEVYLTAPSGKAASRMKDSILTSIEYLISEPDHNVIEKIKNLESRTIHRLLDYSPFENRFLNNAKNQFKPNSIFVIDEASMIDVNIFAALLEAIPEGARVFILGDKNQLPSVECGAVFGALLDDPHLSVFKVELDKSKRFGSGTNIYKLAEKINNGEDLSYIRVSWQDWKTFKVEDDSAEPNTPIYYYLDQIADGEKEKDMIESIAQKWYKKFYEEKDLYGLCTTSCSYSESKTDELKADEPEADEPIDTGAFDKIWKVCEDARILCACNRGVRGIQNINQVILKTFFKDIKKFSGFYPGELLIVTQNDKTLDLYNGDCGVTVQFDGDDTLYLMLKKSTNLCLDNKKVENKIFKLGDYLFYPVRLISTDNILPAFAITIHKSQGSDYNNILVILPRSDKHPLLNRQIVYTAITRTKHSTYILSNQKNLETAKDTKLERDTF